MVNGDVMFELKQLKQTVRTQNELIGKLFAFVNPKNELWDEQDIVHNWKISKRLLADWRAKGIIGFVQVGHKIWYPREARDLFIATYMVKMKEGEND